MRIGLALSGGGAKGFFHLGVIKALARLKIKIDVVAGTSIGSLIGGCYALCGNAGRTQEKLFTTMDKFSKNVLALRGFSLWPEAGEKNIFFGNSLRALKDFFLWHLHIVKPYVVEPRPFLKIFKEVFGEHNFSDCEIPFYATSTDLITGELELFDSGSIFKAVVASCAFPGLFPPIKAGKKLLADGGVIIPLPVSVIKNRDTFVIGVNLERPEKPSPQIKKAIDVLFTSDQIRYKKLLEYNMKEADYLLYPDLEEFGLLDFDKVKTLTKLGEDFTLDKSRQLLRVIRTSRIRKFFLNY